MDRNDIELAIVEKSVNDAAEVGALELNEFQLAYVGGGIGTTVI